MSNQLKMDKNIKFESIQHTTFKDKIRRFFKRSVSFCIRGGRNKNSADLISDNEMVHEVYSPIIKTFEENEPRKYQYNKTGSDQIIRKKLREKTYFMCKNGLDSSEVFLREIPMWIQLLHLKINLIKTELREIDEVIENKKKHKKNKLRCPIPDIEDVQCFLCKTFFIKPVLLNCSHLYCDWCIKEYKLDNNNCPKCDEEIIEMTPSSIMQELVKVAMENTTARIKHEYKLIEYSRAYLEEKMQHEKSRNKMLKTNGFKTEWL